MIISLPKFKVREVIKNVVTKNLKIKHNVVRRSR